MSKTDPVKCLNIIRQKMRPTIKEYMPAVFDDYIELHGDRYFGDDRAILGAVAMFEGVPVTVIGMVKGKTTAENINCNFAMSHPEGYRKSLRLMKQAEKFHRPIIAFVDTAGAFCGVSAEERGQGEAIARNLFEMTSLKTPVLTIITGEGGSGGALALAVSDQVYMFSNAIYSVISPKGFASILWKDASRENEAAKALKLTAEDLLNFGVIDKIIDEPSGGAHVNPRKTYENVRAAIKEFLANYKDMPMDELLTKRYDKYRHLGVFSEE